MTTIARPGRLIKSGPTQAAKTLKPKGKMLRVKPVKPPKPAAPSRPPRSIY